MYLLFKDKGPRPYEFVAAELTLRRARPTLKPHSG
jgi:hypothetical protein